jgi:hypothetical protein
LLGGARALVLPEPDGALASCMPAASAFARATAPMATDRTRFFSTFFSGILVWIVGWINPSLVTCSKEAGSNFSSACFPMFR